MLPHLAYGLVCGAALAALCFAVGVWRLSAARYPDQAYRAAALAAISAVLAAALLLASLAL